jgi:hypothetical protein
MPLSIVLLPELTLPRDSGMFDCHTSWFIIVTIIIGVLTRPSLMALPPTFSLRLPVLLILVPLWPSLLLVSLSWHCHDVWLPFNALVQMLLLVISVLPVLSLMEPLVSYAWQPPNLQTCRVCSSQSTGKSLSWRLMLKYGRYAYPS